MDVVIHNVELSAFSGAQVFVLTLEYLNPDGSAYYTDPVTGDPVFATSVIPTEAFESRAAEYGIDPDTEWEELLELMFYARFLPEGDDPTDPDGLWLAPTVSHARQHRRKRIRAVRGRGQVRGVVGEPPGRAIITEALMLTRTEDADHPLEFLREHTPFSAEHIRVKATYVHQRRSEIRAELDGRSSVAELTRLSDDSGDRARRRPRIGQREPAEVLARRLLGPGAVDDIESAREIPRPSR